MLLFQSDDFFADVEQAEAVDAATRHTATPVEQMADLSTPRKPSLTRQDTVESDSGSTKRDDIKPIACYVDEEDKVPGWKTLLYEYTQGATLHGVRYTTEDAQFAVRK